jgi:hypothetical protein
MKNTLLKKLKKFKNKMILEKYSRKDMEYIDGLIKSQEELLSEQINEDTSATGGPAGAVGSGGIGFGGNSVGGVTTAGMGGVQSSQPSAFPGALNGTDWINGGGQSGSGDISVPYNPSGANRVFQKMKSPMGKSHGGRTGKKSRIGGIDLKKLSNIMKKGGERKKVLDFENFKKDQMDKVTKVKEGRTHKSSYPDKFVGKEEVRLVDRKENFRKEIKSLVQSFDGDFSIKQVGNDFSIHFEDSHIIQVLFRDTYVGVKETSKKFTEEFKYTELGKIKKYIVDILKKF